MPVIHIYTYTHTHIYIHLCVYIYIYICTHIIRIVLRVLCTSSNCLAKTAGHPSPWENSARPSMARCLQKGALVVKILVVVIIIVKIIVVEVVIIIVKVILLHVKDSKHYYEMLFQVNQYHLTSNQSISSKRCVVTVETKIRNHVCKLSSLSLKGAYCMLRTAVCLATVLHAEAIFRDLLPGWLDGWIAGLLDGWMDSWMVVWGATFWSSPPRFLSRAYAEKVVFWFRCLHNQVVIKLL